MSRTSSSRRRRSAISLGPQSTDGGTLAAQASLVAREYGIPAMVGGAWAAFAAKRSGRHPSAGRVYLIALAVI